MSEKTVIILDGHVRSALAAVRSLKAAGYRTVCGSHRRTGLALWSRATDKRFLYPSPLKSRSGFLKVVIQTARECSSPPLIYAFSDSTFLPLSRARDEVLPAARLVVPDQENVEIAFDKLRTVQLAQKLGIPVPRTFAGTDIPASFPVVLKPRHTASWKEDTGVSTSVRFADSAQELQSLRQELKTLTGEEPFVQERIKGPEWGVSVLCDRGRVRALSVHRRLRSLSGFGGASTVRVTLQPPAGMVQSAEKLMQELKWQGVAMVEFKQDERTNTPYLIEINGRFWGSLTLAVRAGVDFPVLTARLAGGTPGEAPDFKRGVYSRYLLGDIKNIFRSPGAFFSYGGPGHYYDVESWSDPLPAVMDVIDKILK